MRKTMNINSIELRGKKRAHLRLKESFSAPHNAMQSPKGNRS